MELDLSGQVRAEGLIQAPFLPPGDLYTLGNVSVDLQDFTAPEQYNLEVCVLASNAINDWNFWVYPD